MIIVATHTAIIDGKLYEGLSSVLKNRLIHANKNFLYIRHYMNGEKKSESFFYKNGKLINRGNIFTFRRYSIIRYISEVIFTYRYIISLKEKNISYIGIDPLNSYSGFLLKKNLNISKNIFYTPDYSPKRFNNKVLNKIYHYIDKICVFGSDEVWNVSTRIVKIREDMGLESTKNILFPNIPLNIQLPETNKKNNFSLVTLGIISDQLDFIGLLNAIKDLKKIYPKIHLSIIGNGPKLEFYQDYCIKAGISKNVTFTGYLKYADAINIVSICSIGIALYNGKWGFNQFGDSIKCREYFQFGLPVLTTNTHATIEDIIELKAGVVTELGKKYYIKGLIEIFENYKELSKNASKLGKKYDGLHSKKISSL